MVILDQLPVDKSFIRPNHMIVRAFNGATSKVVGDIDLELKTGSYVFNVPFQIMNIKFAYSMLLGRPMIHSADAIPSFLHQKIKYIMDGKLVTIRAEESLLVTRSPSVPYIEASEDAIETSF